MEELEQVKKELEEAKAEIVKLKEESSNENVDAIVKSRLAREQKKFSAREEELLKQLQDKESEILKLNTKLGVEDGENKGLEAVLDKIDSLQREIDNQKNSTLQDQKINNFKSRLKNNGFTNDNIDHVMNIIDINKLDDIDIDSLAKFSKRAEPIPSNEGGGNGYIPDDDNIGKKPWGIVKNRR